jgi:predicted dehydrogenase
MPESIYGQAEKLSSLEIETDDNVDIIARYADGLRVTIHLDLYGRPHQKFIAVTGESGTLEWSIDPNRLRFSNSMADEWDEMEYDFERNDMFVNVAKEFLEVLEGRRDMTCTLVDGMAVMKMIEAVRISGSQKLEVNMKTLDASDAAG